MKRFAGILVFIAFATGISAAQDLDYFRKVLSSDNIEAKRTVLLEIRDLHSEKASRVAAQGLTDRNEMVRATASSAVVSMPGAEAARLLIPLLSDKADFVRTEAAYALGRGGDSLAIGPLTRMLQNDGAKEARAAAAVGLGQIGDAAAIEPLAAVFKNSPSEDNEFIRRSAARSIGQIADTARTSGRTIDPTSFRSAISALIKALNSSKETDDTRRESAAALGSIGDPTALPALRSQLNSPDYYLTDNCRHAIARIESGK